MPAVDPGSFILVTGATGYIASHVIVDLLNQGFSVRGTVRSQGKGESLKKGFKMLAGEGWERFEYIVVEDLMKEHGFDTAVQDVNGIIHIAAPLHRTAPKGAWENIVKPSKQGTINLFEAALMYGENVKRIVITSSYIAMEDTRCPPGSMLSEKHWNVPVKEAAIKLGDKLDTFTAYSAGKTWAEEAAWDFIETRKPPFDIATTLQPLVCGPTIHPIASSSTPYSGLNTSNYLLWSYLTGDSDPPSILAAKLPEMPMVDVRDVALAHIRCLVIPAASNKRFAISNEYRTFGEFFDLVQGIPSLTSKFPHASWVDPVKSDKRPVVYGVDATLSKEVQGIQYRDWKETVLDSAHSLAERGKELGWDFGGPERANSWYETHKTGTISSVHYEKLV